MAKKILFIVGSLRKESFNRQLAKKAEALLEEKAEVSYLEYADIPYMNQDLENPVPAEIARIRSEVIGADGIWFFTAEYNHSYPGIIKNLLDWLSRPLEPGNPASGTAIKEKKAALSSVAGKSAGCDCRARMHELLTQIKAEYMEEETGVSLQPESFQTGKLVLTEENEAQLAKQAEAFLAYIS